MPVVSRLISIVLRVAEIAFAAVVAGVIGYYLHQFSHIDAWPQARWIYTEVVAGLSILLVDVVISFAWFAAFGILVDAVHKLNCGSIWRWHFDTYSTNSCGRWKAAEAFSFLSAIVWLASALVGMWFTFRVRGANADGYYGRRRFGRSAV
ncbi:hypothetical protein IFM53868_09890 [Aspergillus udagawae]|uniref:MARVEL domain-containing protein n=1 Tax=Aspergillus udagawae TaxID=91492 RepID=A0ABQ1BCS7_9EURO|nr:hypothetical protein IFM53868_09890 [Aspergillus udagawae]